uniref:Bifunctional inhibitor/plant lipid transfer protein/seed storage helical domain-containing protein n=1 Tax=Setaria digitata TaxID=48799 RepID=A0A915PZL0_9BILA
MISISKHVEIVIFRCPCQNCRCIPDYCPQTIPRSLCPCDGPQTACNQVTSPMQTLLTDSTNVHQQPFVVPQALNAQYFLVQQPSQLISAQIPGQAMVSQQLMQTLSLLQQEQTRLGMQQSNIPPVYVIRTIEQPGQVLRQVQQIAEPVVPRYISSVQPVPIQQTQMILVPTGQQTVPLIQQLALPLQVPMQTITLQVPVTMAEHCTPRPNVCPLGLPSVHAVTECDNVTDSTATRCITVEEARRLYTCLPHFNFNKLWNN